MRIRSISGFISGPAGWAVCGRFLSDLLTYPLHRTKVSELSLGFFAGRAAQEF